MLEKYKYVFIVGAGGSKPYGFPLGLELYNNIKNNFTSYIAKFKNGFIGNGTNGRMPDYGRLDGFQAEAERFTRELNKTNNIQIDKYLNINRSFKDIGISAIVTEIYNSEISSLPIINDIENNWYSYLYSKMTEGLKGLNTSEELKSIHANKISFITFNYDRSLEHYLFENLYGLLKNAGINRKTLAESFKNIPFIHVFGKIGYLPWEKGFYDDQKINDVRKNVVGYGIKDFNLIQIGIEFRNMIDIMYSSRENNHEIKHAQDLISDADRILFLGFGYDDQNLEILKIPEILENKQVFGTAYQATKNEIVHIKNKLGFASDDIRYKIYNYDCLTLLREHLI